MAISIRNLLTFYPRTPDYLEAADRLVGRFVRDGMEALMPIPTSANPSRRYTETWGAEPEYGDFEILTAESYVAGQLRTDNERRASIKTVEHNWTNYNTFTLADHHDRIMAAQLPGFLGRGLAPAALVVFHTKSSVPNRWIEHVINSEHEHLVLHMHSYEPMERFDFHYALEQNPNAALTHKQFHFYTSAPNEWIQSAHCAGVIHEINSLDVDGDGSDDPNPLEVGQDTESKG
jgi:hypothetical protein